jgi:hypothetical protein
MGLIVSSPGLQSTKRVVLTWLFATVCSSATLWTPSFAQTLRDDFGDGYEKQIGEWDYTSGKVPSGSIWKGIHNPRNGGDRENPAAFLANGVGPDGKSRPGRLYIEDLGLHRNKLHDPPGNPLLGVGWEFETTGRNSAPFLFTEVDSRKDFDAVLKVSTQFAGPWSYLAIIVRRAGPPTGFGSGEPLAAEESFVTAGSFRPNADNSGEIFLIVQNAINGGAPTPSEVTCDFAPAGPSGALPAWIRFSKRGDRFTAASSLDGISWVEPSDASFTNSELAVDGRTLEVGISYMRFDNPVTPEGERPAAVVDYFELTFVEVPNFAIGWWAVLGIAILAAAVALVKFAPRSRVVATPADGG